MAGKHILVMIYFTSLLLALMISSSFSADQYQTFVPTSLPARQTVVEEEEALSSYSWDDNTENRSESSTSTGFSVTLHSVDILSPQGTSPKSLFIKRLDRDTVRADMILAITKKSSSAANNGQLSSPVMSGIQWGSGEYFASIGVGSPSTDFYMVMDTGSDTTWLQCLPCKKCYNQTDPIFNPSTSSSFHQVPCGSETCGKDTNGYCRNHKKCPYNISYGDGSFSSGEVANETLTFGKSTEVPNVTLGCGHHNEGLFVAAAGLFGLGRDRQSFLSQAGSRFGNIFSYCLASRGVASPGPSTLKFGYAYGNAVYTPLLTNPNLDFIKTFYYVGLEGISVGGSRVQGINASTFDFDRKTGDGGVIVDSGTVVTRLTNHTYSALRDAFQNATSEMLKKLLLKAHSDIEPSIFDTCYNFSGITTNISVPSMDLHFGGGADVSLPTNNYVIPVDENGTVCFGFAGTQPDGGLSVIGSFLQQSIGVVFDLNNNRVGFAEKACS